MLHSIWLILISYSSDSERGFSHSDIEINTLINKVFFRFGIETIDVMY